MPLLYSILFLLPYDAQRCFASRCPAAANMPQSSYEGLSSGCKDVVLFAESLEEIMADELEAFARSKHIRHRDIWDLHWLMRRPGIDLDEACALRARKEADCGEAERFAKGIRRLEDEPPDIVEGGESAKRMRRSPPRSINTSAR